jgi:transposase-like protein
MAVLEAIRNGDLATGDLLREAVSRFVQELMEAEVSAQIGANRYERTEERTAQRNGYRARRWDTSVGTLALQIPRVRTKSFFPILIEPRRRSERALVAVVAEAYVKGVSTRKVEALAQSLGITSLSKSEVSRLCAVLDEQVALFRSRRLDAEYPYVWLDARYEHVRDGGRVITMAVIGAYGLRADGVREVLGIDVGVSEHTVLWRAFLQGLVGRGLRGVQLVISDARRAEGRDSARCSSARAGSAVRSNFARSIEARVLKGQQAMVGALVRSIVQQESGAMAQSRLGTVCDLLRERYPTVLHLLVDAEEEILAFYAFPEAHWSKLRSTNPYERLNKELKRRSAVVGIFPTREAVLRLLGSVLIEQNDEWLVGHTYVSAESMAALRRPPPEVPSLLPDGTAAQSAWTHAAPIYTTSWGTTRADPRPRHRRKLDTTQIYVHLARTNARKEMEATSL